MADGRKTCAMFGRCPKERECLEMGGGTIALVLGKPIVGIVCIQVTHEAVTRDFGNNRSGGNRERQAITVYETLLREMKGMKDERIEE